jgi:hypothetical protein
MGTGSMFEETGPSLAIGKWTCVDEVGVGESLAWSWIGETTPRPREVSPGIAMPPRPNTG